MDTYDSRFCIVTPSYKPDFQRCQLLCRSIDRYVPEDVRHYIIVDKRDVGLFKTLENYRTSIVLKEDLLPKWIKQIPFIKKNVWISYKTIPVRGWIVQQIIKIAAAQLFQEEVTTFVDSDVVFLRQFSPETVMRNGSLRFYKKPHVIEKDMEEGHFSWYEVASTLLGISMPPFPATDYINQIVSWRKENVSAMCQRIESVTGISWIEALANSWNFSEYVLDGLFIDCVVGADQSGHYYESNDICLNYWYGETSSNSLQSNSLATVRNQLDSKQVATMVSAKAGLDVLSFDG